ncbi:MAG: VWA domain-containing protein [Deltaproteobacteria bacterium]|nr:VWA domain-containing protein [Deltaproteobacteria bacterium]
MAVKNPAFGTLAGVAFAAAAIVAGCGSQRPEPAGTFVLTPPDPGGGGGGLFDAGTKPPGCGKKDDGSYCDCVDVPLFTNPPNMYFVLDHSGSMADGEKWNAVRTVVAKILRGLGPRANYGATMYPGLAAQTCAPPVEILPISPGDPLGQGDGPTTTKLLAATDIAPFGGTPTAAALRFAGSKLASAKGKTFVILFTDGGPNCGSTPCTVDKCMPNIEAIPGCPAAGPTNCCEAPEGSVEACLDGAATASAVASLKASGFPVYVVGIPGSVKYAALLDQLAVAGGTAQATAGPKYFQINSTNDSEILAVLKRISAQIVATCEFQLTEPPAAPENVNVYLDEVVLPADPVNGWKIEGAKVTLLGDACQKLLRGDVLGVRIIAGCPTVKPR